MNWYTRYIRAPFARARQNIPWLGPVISTVLITMTISLLYDWLKEIAGLPGAAGLIASLAGLTLLVVYGYNLHTRRRRRQMATRVVDKPNPPQYKGLILMVSRLETAREAIDYHKDALQCCWLITTPAPWIRQHADQLKQEYEDAISYVDIAHIANEYDTRGCYELVRGIHHREAARLGLLPGEVIADITGGTKPMTMGMILACVEGEFPIEHIPTEYDPVTSKPKGPLPPIQISIDVPPWDVEFSKEQE